MEKSSLTALTRQQLKIAKEASSGRSAHTVYGGHEHTLRQTRPMRCRHLDFAYVTVGVTPISVRAIIDAGLEIDRVDLEPRTW